MARAWKTRRFFRVTFDTPLVVRVNRLHKKAVRPVEKNVRGKLIDVSEGGCACDVTVFLPKLGRVDLFLERADLAQAAGLPPAEGRTQIIATVVSCSFKALKKYRLSLQFVKISKTDRELIAALVKNNERRK